MVNKCDPIPVRESLMKLSILIGCGMSPNRELLRDLEGHGYVARMVPVDRLADLREDIEAGRRNGLYDDDLYREYLSGFVFGPPAELRDARSIIVIATTDACKLYFPPGGQECDGRCTCHIPAWPRDG